MQQIRTQNIGGRSRRIFLCECGREIFFVKSGTKFVKYTTDDMKHTCDFVMKFSKSCFDCSKDIKIYRQGSSWIKENLDGSEHKCKKGYEEDADEEEEVTSDWILVNEWSEECNDSEEECDIDNVHEYKLPDGTTRIIRNHTW